MSAAAFHGLVAAKRRILFYVQDSWGLGHIQRVSKLARALQDSAECLILCGHREAGRIVPEGCEYIRIPSLDVPLSHGSGGVFWGRPSPWRWDCEEALALRRRLIESAVTAFRPHIIVVENRPLGMMNELRPILHGTSATKIFLSRGIMTHPSRVRQHFLDPDQEEALRSSFDRIIVAADRRVWDLAAEYELDAEIARKIDYVGYMSEAVGEPEIATTRAERGVHQNRRWIVCSAGGGALGEPLIEAFSDVAALLRGLAVDIVHGPHSQVAWPEGVNVSTAGADIRLHKECARLALLHASADVIVCPGGYNSIVECMEGGGRIIAMPVQPDQDGEQHLFCSRLAKFYPITTVCAAAKLRQTLLETVASSHERRSVRAYGQLDFDGLRRARDLLLSI
jgi:predicted glycosyltransferase